ncbi:MAG: hypothetical protein IJN86_00895 [Clostridia bacterium]|nr:hypothetical protein [Clostridia bacterium]MBQ7047484.1 hypothetical protein [Clostridia bacterium]
MDRDNYISDEQVIKRANAAVKFAIEKKKITNTPIVAYDRKSGVVYNLNSDGSKTVVATRTTKGRYSERNAKN